jgi:hypothetical protein
VNLRRMLMMDFSLLAIEQEVNSLRASDVEPESSRRDITVTLRSLVAKLRDGNRGGQVAALVWTRSHDAEAPKLPS